MQQQDPAWPASSGARSTSAVADQAKEIARTGTEQAKQIGQTAKERALREIDLRREQIAGQVERLAGNLERQRTESEEAMPVLDLAADGARRLSGALKERSAEDLLRSVGRSPTAVLAGSFALGFLAIRLFKA